MYKYLFLDNIDQSISTNEYDLNSILPIITIDTQKERNNITKEIEEMLNKRTENVASLNSVDMINILFGIYNLEGKSKEYR